MEIDMRFFQAVATAIPTLFVAVIVSAKLFHVDDEKPSIFAPRSFWEALLLAFYMYCLLFAEMAALAVLVTGQPNYWAVLTCGYVVYLQMLVLGAIPLHKSFSRYTSKNLILRYSLRIVLFVLAVIPAAMFGLPVQIAFGEF